MTTHIAIVDCQPLPAAVQQRTGYKGFFEAFTRLFELAGAKGVVFDRYNAFLGEFPSLEDSIPCAIVVSGSFSSAYTDEDWILTLKNNLRSIHGKAPVIGICFGHQIVAEALGGKCGPMARGPEVGCVSAQLTAPGRRIFQSLSDQTLNRDNIRLVYFHFDEVKILPPGAVLLASSESCPVEAFCVPNEHILCLQGHPEFGSNLELMRALLDSSLENGKLCCEDYQKAVTSLELPADSLEIGASLLRFALSASTIFESLSLHASP
ncbi:hypothetical protein CCYA_CCYA13G3612 [Cyanidiococcus yangmingshanensis]|uniref:Glutamine amidotransferase domain-containing protein n=1 Tax=Cyanidiococcus yangmingshanensis TaxID=2690220 RepID=A0A7J7IFB0_9RHOD|nr:hypothetical protein F1559_000584 [Cyanidiococcus yangmingshanensis]KAK4532755.1 hypothetical protein CCYA_CCYA13G3612 [Cyanidiococcus yangmingshanensis]